MKTIKNKRGISLIVLVITIIVMIILAAAIILSLNGSGILSKANEAVTKSDEANTKYVVALAKAEWDLMSKKEKEDAGNDLKKYIQDKLKAVGIKGVEINDKGEIVKGTYTIYTDSNGKTAPIPNGFTVSTISEETTIERGLVIYEGSAPVTDLDSDSNGIMDAQETRNQFVWIPVPDITKFQRTTTYNGTITSPGTSYTEPASLVCNNYNKNTCIDETTLSLTNDATGEWKEEAAMRASVEKYGGFYIGRYEAGTTSAREEGQEFGTTDVLVQKNKPVYDHVGWGPAMDKTTGDVTIANAQGKGAVELARELYNTSSVKSTLTYGVQWDAAVAFIAKIHSGWIGTSDYSGNIEDTLIKTGSNYDYKRNNIYDMAGNAEEWTMEAYSSENRVVRGGIFLDNSPSYDLQPHGDTSDEVVVSQGLVPGITIDPNISIIGTKKTSYSYRRAVSPWYKGMASIMGGNVVIDDRDFSSYGFRPSLYLK